MDDMTGLKFDSSPQFSVSDCNGSCEKAQGTAGFNGFASNVNLGDLVQLACLENKDRKLLVLSGHCSGEIYFSKGEVVHSQTGNKSGEEAFYEIMAWNSGTFKFLEGTADTRTIEIPWNFLLIEALRIKDEKKLQEKDKGKETSRANILVVDDSRFFVSRLTDFLEGHLGARIQGEALNGREALDFLSKETPDLITLDINMPVMAGDVALKHIMIKSPAPVVLISNFNERSAGKIMEFLRLGAVDFIAKPMGEQPWEVFAKRLEDVVTNAPHFQIKNIRRARNPKPASKTRDPGMPADKMIVFVGGYGALLELQKILPALDLQDRCGVVIFQHMCPILVEHVANYMEPLCAFSLKGLGKGAPLLSNQAWLTALEGAWNVKADEAGAGIYRCDDSCGEFGKGFNTGSVFQSLSDIFLRDLAVVVLSGADSAIFDGLQHVAMADGRILVQRPETSLHPFSLEQLNELQLATEVMAPEEMAPFLKDWISGS